MTKNDQNKPSNIVTLRINKLRGRMLRIDSKTKKRSNILLVYGLHSNIERWASLAEDLSQYGNVIVPDMPGLGGMVSYYNIGQKPSIDKMADYLASFVKLKYKNKRIKIVGLSVGFVVVTRMLQKYPDIAKKVDGVVSISGFTHYEDYNIASQKRNFYRFVTFIAKSRLIASICHLYMSQNAILRLVYGRVYEKQASKGTDNEDYRRFVDEHAVLWRQNDMRTHMALLHELLKLNNCRQHIDVPVWHVSSTADSYINQHVSEQHMRVVYKNLTYLKTKTKPQAGILTEGDRTAIFLPQKIRRKLLG